MREGEVKEQPLTVGGRPFELRRRKPAVEKLREFLDGSPDHEVFLTKDIPASASTAFMFVSDPAHGAYVVKHSQMNYFGNPKAIARLKAEIAKAGK